MVRLYALTCNQQIPILVVGDQGAGMARGTAAAATGTAVDNLSLLGGRLCLDFANTLDPRFGEERRDFLDSYAALVAWGVHVGILSLGEMRRLLAEAERRPNDADAVRQQAVALRGAL